MSAITLRRPDAGRAYLVAGALGWGDWMSGSLPG
jgi:hypothetical protein